MCDIFLIVPLVLYLTLADPSSFAQYHQTYINMIFSAYAPLGISWWIVLADDSKAARNSLIAGIEMAGLGPFALLWVGFASFMMQAKSGNVLNNYLIWIWAIIYPVVNILLVVMHYHLAPPMFAWIAISKVRPNAIDNVRPWAEPK